MARYIVLGAQKKRTARRRIRLGVTGLRREKAGGAAAGPPECYWVIASPTAPIVNPPLIPAYCSDLLLPYRPAKKR